MAKFRNSNLFNKYNSEDLSANKTLDTTSAQIQFLNPNGSNRDVILPADASCAGLIYYFINLAPTTYTLTIKDSSSVDIQTIEPSESISIICNGSSWGKYTGNSGFSGILGTSGISGILGISGFLGESGSSGISGEKGSDGASGISGTSGTSGVKGATGDTGDQGINGTLGILGATGTSGTSGITGTPGISGKSGEKGTSGTSGATGTSGISGISGVRGASGNSGTTGTSGKSGTSGATGTSGTSGITGTSGISGKSGAKGSTGTSGTSGISGKSGAVQKKEVKRSLNGTALGVQFSPVWRPLFLNNSIDIIPNWSRTGTPAGTAIVNGVRSGVFANYVGANNKFRIYWLQTGTTVTNSRSNAHMTAIFKIYGNHAINSTDTPPLQGTAVMTGFPYTATTRKWNFVNLGGLATLPGTKFTAKIWMYASYDDTAYTNFIVKYVDAGFNATANGLSKNTVLTLNI